MVNLTSPSSLPENRPSKQTDVGKPPTPRHESVDCNLRMPHERDESIDMTDEKPSPHIEQAAVDLKRGVQDTSKGAELHSAYTKLK